MERNRYIRLPGVRRGIVIGSSVWLGADHLLLVRSTRVREDYKRIYLRDIQAIVTARAPRFHISSRSLLPGCVWSFATLVASIAGHRAESVTIGLLLGGLALALSWAYISAKCSCRCRIYTAVSAEPVASVYRTWTARRFLARVEPLILEAQGSLAPDASSQVKDRQIGPLPDGRVEFRLPGEEPRAVPEVAAAFPARAAIAFVSVLVLGGAADLAALGARPAVARPLLLGFLFLQVCGAVWSIFEGRGHQAYAGLRKFAVVALAAAGLWYMGMNLTASFVTGMRNAQSRGTVPVGMPTAFTVADYPPSRAVAGGADLLLGFAGAVLLLRARRQERDGVSPND
jgi:hypothetical protein